jgi:integrase
MAELFRRGGIWYAWIPTFLADGRVRLRKRSTKSADRKAAVAIARTFERESADPDGATKSAATLSDALDILISDRESKANARPPKASHATVEFYRKEAGIVTSVLAPAWDPETPDRSLDLPLRAVTATRVDDYIAQRRGEGVKDTTIHKELTAWRKAMRLAKRANLWDGEIDRVFPVAFAPDYKPRERWMTPAEWLLLLTDAEALDQPECRRKDTTRSRIAILAAVAFIAATSAEWGAVLRARPEDVNLESWRVRIRGTKDAQRGANRERVVPIVHLGHAFLLTFAMQHADGGGVLLFRTRGNFRRDLAAACKRAGIGRLSPNDLRRTHAQWLRRGGVQPADLAPVMGHADSRMVERVYGRITAVDLAPRLAASLATGSHLVDTSGETAHHRRAWQTPDPAFLSRNVVPRDGIEPPTRGFSIPCSTN